MAQKGRPRALPLGAPMLSVAAIALIQDDGIPIYIYIFLFVCVCVCVSVSLFSLPFCPSGALVSKFVACSVDLMTIEERPEPLYSLYNSSPPWGWMPHDS